jgi:RsiW-degrading membrane proteinase PrsW (M82 family)
MFVHERICAACGAAGSGNYCGNCGRDYHFGAPSWQDGIYLGASAPVYRRGPREIRRALPILLAPFKHLHAIPTAVWRFALFVAIIGVAPLVANTVFGEANTSLWKFWSIGLYFALVWAAFFGALFVDAGIRWRLAVYALFGTMLAGLAILDAALMLQLENLRDPFLNANSLIVSVPSFVVFVGFPEELCKALVLFAIWRWAPLPTLRAFIYYGILSGLGFGIAEGIHYQRGVYYDSAMHTGNFVEYFFVSVLRLTSLPLLHAAWTGTAAFLLWFAARVRTARTGLVLLAIALPALMHGLYDGLSDAAPLLSLAVAVSSVALLAIYIASAAELETGFAITDTEPEGLHQATFRTTK